MTRTGTYQVALHQGTYFLKLSGHLGFSSSVPFAKIIEVIGDAPDCTGALIDLRDVDMIDSTHLGLIARLALEAQSKLGQQLTIVSTGKHVPHALKTTGLQHLALVIDAHHGEIPAVELIQSLPASKRSVAQVMLEAHQTLISLNQDNKNTYQDVVAMLQNSMQKKR